MSENTNAVTVRIAGEEHLLRASAEPEYLRRCARFVDQRIVEIRERAGLLEGHRVAILAALSITDEYLQAKEGLERLEQEVAERAEDLAQRLDDAFGIPVDPGGQGQASEDRERPRPG